MNAETDNSDSDGKNNLGVCSVTDASGDNTEEEILYPCPSVCQ